MKQVQTKWTSSDKNTNRQWYGTGQWAYLFVLSLLFVHLTKALGAWLFISIPFQCPTTKKISSLVAMHIPFACISLRPSGSNLLLVYFCYRHTAILNRTFWGPADKFQRHKIQQAAGKFSKIATDEWRNLTLKFLFFNDKDFLSPCCVFLPKPESKYAPLKYDESIDKAAK